MAKEKKEGLGLLARTFRKFDPVIIFEDRPYTWNVDIDNTKGDLIHVDVEDDEIDDDHLKFVGYKNDSGRRDAIEFDHAVAGPVKDAKLIVSADKVMGEQSHHIGVYTLAKRDEYEALPKKKKALVKCEKFLAHVGAISAFAAAANDTGADVVDAPEQDDVLVLTHDNRFNKNALNLDTDEVDLGEPRTEPLVLNEEQRTDLPAPGQD